MEAIRKSEVRRIIFEASEEEKAQCNINSYFDDIEGQPKSKL